MRIKITKSGPYLVTGGVPLREKIITPMGRGYRLTEGRELPQTKSYALCRCGRSRTAPFCDGAHMNSGFVGKETASRALYEQRAQRQEGISLDLMDDGRCAYVRFCHTNKGDVWTLAETADTAELRELAVRATGECLAGRLVAVQKDGRILEPELSPGINILQDPEKEVSGGIYVMGGIPVESADGYEYEQRNRFVLCRCGRSQNKPYCDGMHATGNGFVDR